MHGRRGSAWVECAEKQADEIRLMDSSRETLLGWSAKQGSILTGGGSLLEHSQPGRDFVESDLPHYYLQQRTTRQQFATWLADDRRSHAVVGCWSRPLFAGGWHEDSDRETDAYNLQTPSLFVDLRFPVLRPTEALLEGGCACTADCSPEQLRLLARQHCFAGYTLPEPPLSTPAAAAAAVSSSSSKSPLFTRHHIIDWNFHPSFPRSRPNRWFVQRSPDGQCFKEHSSARDADGVPVYFERWARRQGDGGGEKYLALRRDNECPAAAAKAGRTPGRDGVLVLVGSHFAAAIDRPSMPAFAGCPGPAAAPLVDQALSLALHAEVSTYLDLEGSYGRAGEGLRVLRCTHPWREGRTLFAAPPALELGPDARPVAVCWGADRWTVLENSYSVAELRAALGVRLLAQL